MKINVMVHTPVCVSSGEEGVFKTKITHPKLDGELFFFHGENNREQTLGVLCNSITEDISEIVKTIEDLLKK